MSLSPARESVVLPEHFLRDYRIGIDVEENVPQFLSADAFLRRVKLMLHIADEFLGILGSIVFAVFESAADDVVGDIVGLPELVALYYPDIHGMPDEFIAVILVTQGGHGDFLRSERLPYV